MTIELERRDAEAAGMVAAVDRFPWSVGRSGADLLVPEPGVWDRHFVMSRGEGHSFTVVPGSDAPLTLNGVPVQEVTTLRNGDRIGCGAVEFQFRLAPTLPKPLGLREGGTWVFLTAWLVLQVLLALIWPQ
ncbi:MAG: FHA domain-containing protein [Verrucomicrobia bacterium]|nr:FHA domain-containing protein [Verrucomicrobiota bacterium]